ncbi:MAG TPA: lysylphosphatidylglycerol synthase transmembrane domain-containing protein [Candidatus Binatia bacterium]|nr:lysylphosphatidylglycerol synthase transmembrane domain-containing protein [Candidatus Binatia bacterium]
MSFGCLYLATRGTDWAAVGAVLTGTRPGWVFGMIGVGLLTLGIRAQRWRVLLRPVGDVGFEPSLSATAIGFGASAVLPLRLGEFVRPALLGRRAGIGLSPALSSVVVERLFDMLVVIGCALATGLVYPLPGSLRRVAAALGVLSVAGLVVLLIMLRNRARTELLIARRLPRRLAATVGPLLHGFLAGLGSLADAGTVVAALGYSALLWGVIALTWMCGLLALALPVPPLAASLTVMVTVAAFVFLPQGPGFVGTWQAGCVLALALFDTPRETAIGYSLLTWLGMMGTNLLAGGLFLAREDVSLRQLLRVAGPEGPPAPAEG